MRRLAFALAILSALLPGSAWAQAWPSKPIRIIVPFPAGGATDTAARLVQPGLQQALGVPVVIENRPGASGALGTGQVAHSPPDGTVLLMTLDTHTVNAAVMQNIPYDPVRDFAPIVRIGTMPYVLVANEALPVKSLQELVALAKAEPGKLNYGSPAVAVQLAMELFKSLAGIDVKHVAYRGGAPAAQSVIANETQLTFLPPVSAMSSIQSGKLRPLAVAGAARLSALPDVPTVGECGYAGFEAGSWAGLLAPAGVPQAVVDRLFQEMTAVLQPPDIQQRFASLGLEVHPIGPEAFAEFISQQVTKWTRLAHEHHVTAD